MISILATLVFTASAVEIPHESYVMDNGMTVLLMEDHALPQVVVDLWYGVGSFDDPAGASGFAHLFEHLMFMGTEVVDEFDPIMEAAGGANNASTMDDVTNYYSWGTSNVLDLLLFLEADRMTGLDITQEKLNLQREVVRNELRQNYEDPPYGPVWLEIPAMIYPEGHPYRLSGIGSHEDLLNASLEHVQSFYESWYAPNNVTLVVAGDFEEEHVRSRITEYFGHLQPAVVPAHQTVSTIDAPVTSRRVLERDVPAPAVIMAWPTPSYFADGDAELDVISDLLSGTTASRLDRRLVMGDEGVQQMWASQMSSKNGSIFMVYMLAEPGADLDHIESVVTEELAALAGSSPATESELASYNLRSERSVVEGLEGLLARAESLQMYQFYTGNADGVEADLQRHRDVTPSDVASTVEAYLTPERSAVLRVLPLSEVEEVEATESSTEGGDQ